MRKHVNKPPTNKGFTIVELLIVIVIIGILAGLVIATARSIQDRANNSTYLATYQNVYKQLQGSLTINGYAAINSVPADNQVCIGKTTDYDSDGVGDCDSWKPDAGTISYDPTHQSTGLEAALAKVSASPAGKFSKPFSLYIPSSSGTTTIHNAILHGYTVVPPSSDPAGEMRITNTNTQLAYVFGGPLYGDNQNCGTNSVQMDLASTTVVSGRIISYFKYAQNEPLLASPGMTYCTYAISAP